MVNEVQNQPDEEKKEERIDELDIIGGSIFLLIRNVFSKILSFIALKKVE